MRVWDPKLCAPKMARPDFPDGKFRFFPRWSLWSGGGSGGGGLARGHGVALFAFGGAYWPLALAHSDPLWARTWFGCVRGVGVTLLLVIKKN